MTTSVPAVALLVIGILILLVTGIWTIVIAFRRSLVWGLCYLFVPLAALVFLFVAWADVRRTFLLHVAGFVMAAGGLFLMIPEGFDLKQAIAGEFLRELTLPTVKVSDPNEALQKRLAELTAREQTLRARKAALDPQDIAAASALKDEILLYNADLKAATDEKAALAQRGGSVVSYNSPPK